MNLKEMGLREGIPSNIFLEQESVGEGYTLLRATDGKRGAEVLITPSARQMYGEGPSLVAALSRLKKLVDAGLPEQKADGSWHHEELADI